MRRITGSIFFFLSALLLHSCMPLAPQAPAWQADTTAVYTPGEPGRISEDGTKIFYDPKLCDSDKYQRLLNEALQRQQLFPH